MHFLIISKKEGFKEEFVNDEYLDSTMAPSLISEEVLKVEISSFIIYLYLYNQIQDEKNNVLYEKEKLLLMNGIVNDLNKVINEEIPEFFKKIDGFDLVGDYQLISIDKNGNGIFKTPSFSIKQLFSYENEYFSVLSTEIKLIYDGIRNLRKNKFVDNFDVDYIEDATFREGNLRKSPRHTIFKDIKRVLPYDEKFFENGKIIINKGKFEVPIEFKEKFNNDKKSLYDCYYDKLINLIEQNLVNLKKNISKITLGLTGGFDSRLSLSILEKICVKHNIPLECYVFGNENHPDVIIAEKVAKYLNIPFKHTTKHSGKLVLPIKITDYMMSFYTTQGDFNSNDFQHDYTRKIGDSTIINPLGMDGFKRFDENKYYAATRWFSRVILYRHNFFLPLFMTDYDFYFAHLLGEDLYEEFIYEMFKRSNPNLLKIPFATQSLLNADIKPYSTNEEAFHDKPPFFWDYKYVKKQLKSVMMKNFNQKLGMKGKLLIFMVGLNELDFFLDNEIYEIIDLYRKGKISLKKSIKSLTKLKSSKKYPKERIMVKINKRDELMMLKRIMIILMDFASVADMHSFEEIEKKLG